MRKYALGIIIGLIFLAYSTALRHQHSRPVIAPAALAQGSSTGSSTSSTAPSTQYKDGKYTGSVANAYYGNVQVQAVVNGCKITTINFLQSPNENPNSIYINQQADPYLKQEAIQAQSSRVSAISGATFTSQAFIQSLANALSQAN